MKVSKTFSEIEKKPTTEEVSMTRSGSTAEKTAKAPSMGRREFVKSLAGTAGGIYFFVLFKNPVLASALEAGTGHGPDNFLYGFIVDTTKCIGCNSCARACRLENKVPATYHRTWVERHVVCKDGERRVDVAKEPDLMFEPLESPCEGGESHGYFIPKLCNHCEKSVCIQVCPVGATFRTPDGVVLVDGKHCVGCGYCIQACPYGTRFKNPETHVADKCTLCYHRISKGMNTACVEVCPTGARQFGNQHDPNGEISRILKERNYSVLGPEFGTQPQCYYIGLEQGVK